MIPFDKKMVIVIVAVAIGVVQLGLAGVAGLIRKGTIEDLSVQEGQLEMLRQQLSRASEQPGALDVRAAERWHLHDGPGVVTTMQQVQKLGDATGIAFDGLKAMLSADNGKQAFVVTGHGEPSKVCSFMAAIEQDDRLMIIETGRLLPAGGGQMAFEFGLATYYAGAQK